MEERTLRKHSNFEQISNAYIPELSLKMKEMAAEILREKSIFCISPILTIDNMP